MSAKKVTERIKSSFSSLTKEISDYYSKIGNLPFFQKMFRKRVLVGHWVYSHIVSKAFFDKFILLAIIASTIFLAMADYSNVDNHNNLEAEGSIGNTLLLGSELAFTIIFITEFLLKALATGLIRSPYERDPDSLLDNRPKPYFSDSWNWLDFVVVFFAILALTPLPSTNLKVFRSFRVLRPLKAIKSLPGVAAIVSVLLISMPLMVDILSAIMFSFFIFAIIGLQIFNGPYLHARCRLTPFPVNISWVPTLVPINSSMPSSGYYSQLSYGGSIGNNPNTQYLLDYNEYRCLDAPNFDTPQEFPTWEQADSPWFTSQSNCYWPIDNNDQNVCALPMTDGTYFCENGEDTGLTLSNWRWCGSNYDAVGNPRFNATTAYLGTFTNNLYFGNVNFDNVGYAFSFVVQVISGDSWSTLMFALKDSFSYTLGVLFCFLIILYGSFFLLQLNVAVLQMIFTEKSKSIKDTISKTGLLGGKKKVAVLEEGDELPSAPLPLIPYTKIVGDHNEAVRADCYLVDDEDEVDEPMLQMKGWEEIYNNSIKNAILQSKSHSTSFKFTSLQLKVLPVDEFVDNTNETITDSPIDSKESIKPDPNKPYSYLDTIVETIKKYDNPELFAFRRLNKYVMESIIFQNFFNLMILLNTIILAFDKYPQTTDIANSVEAISFLLTIMFCLEMVVILLGLGTIKYFSNRFNCIDFIIVIISITDLAASPIPTAFTGVTNPTKSGSANALRSLRLLRLLKLFRSDTFKALIIKIMTVIQSMQDFLVILILFLVLFALLGMQLFANRFRFDENGLPITAYNTEAFYNAPDRPRSNFDNFTIAFLAVFQIISVDNWTVVMMNCSRALGPSAMIFAMFIFFMGNFFLTNLVLALLVENFCDDSHVDNYVDDDDMNPLINVDAGSIINVFAGSRSTSVPKINRGDNIELEGQVTEAELEPLVRNSTKKPIFKQLMYKKLHDSVTHMINGRIFETVMFFFIVLSSVTLAFDNPLNDPTSTLVITIYYIDIVVTIVFTLEMILKMFSHGIVFSEDAYFRDGWNVLDFLVVIVSIISLIRLKGNGLKSLRAIRSLKALRTLRLVSQLQGLKVIFLSLILSIPAISQIGSIVFLVYFMFAIFFTTFLKGQLRSCQRAPFLTNNTYYNFETYPLSWTSLSVEQQSWFGSGPMSLIPENSFNSTLCSEFWPSLPCCNTYASNAASPTSRDICECWGGSWLPVTDFRFDNVGMSLMTLFDDGTVDNWSDNMHYVADSNGIDMEPIRDNNLIWYYIFFVFIIVGFYLCIQLFIGAICKSFSDSRDKLGNGTSTFVTKDQQEWINATKIMNAVKVKKKQKRPQNTFRGICFDICNSNYFEPCVMLCVVAQCLVLSMTYFGQPDFYSNRLNTINIVLAIIFFVEMVIKLIGLGFIEYFSSRWNILDFVIVLGSSAGLINLLVSGNKNGLIINLVRILRLARILRLIQGIDSVRKLLDCMIMILPALTNICVLLFFGLYIFAIIGIEFFAKIAYYNTYNYDSNYRTFGNAFVILYRMTTSDNWGQLMYDLAYKTKGCVDDPPYDPRYCGFSNHPGCLPLNGCGSSFSFAYWTVYIILITFVLLSVFISVIISTYQEVKHAPISADDYHTFADLWKEIDKDATGYINIDLLYQFVSKLHPPLGFRNTAFTLRQYGRRVDNVRLYLVEDEFKVFYKDIIDSLSKAYFHRRSKYKKNVSYENEVEEKPNFISRNLNNFASYFHKITFEESPHHLRFPQPADDFFTVKHYMAAIKIQYVWRIKMESRLDQNENKQQDQ